MFDNVNNQTPVAEPEDIFKDTETSVVPPVVSSEIDSTIGLPSVIGQTIKPSGQLTGWLKRNWIWLVGGIVVLVLAVTGYLLLKKSATPASVTLPLTVNNDMTNNAVNNNNQPTNINIKADNSPLDSDGDGLTDDEEKTLGTNPYSADTDQDGLYDREEVKVYHTDPNNPDTDGDGYKDGDEVKNGYNPLGAGKLLQLPAAQ